MQTVLYVARMETGKEVAVREAHERFPIEALARGAGVERVVAFIGSGYYAFELTVADGDFQANLHRFLSTAEVRALFDDLRPHVHDLPSPDQGTAAMPLATAMLVWQSRPGEDLTTV